MKPILTCKSVRKAYPFESETVPALEDTSFELYAAQIYRIHCSSRLARLSLANLLSGMERADAGDIELCGQSYTRLGEDDLNLLRLHRIGLIHSRPGLVSSATVLHNVILPALFLENQSATESELSERAAKLLHLFGIEEYAHLFPNALDASGRLRTAICAELCKHPALLIIDGSVDTLSQKEQTQLVLQLQRAARRTNCAVVILSQQDACSPEEIALAV